MKDTGGGFARWMNVERIGREPMTFDIRATVEDCAALAKSLDILDLSDVSASGSLVRQSTDGQVKLNGRIAARAIQACVATLDPVDQSIDEEYTVFYTFDPEDLVVDEFDKVVGIEEPDLPELIVNNRIDLVAMITEQIALALDPYPRSAGLPKPAENDEMDLDQVKKEQRTHQPFANLKDLMSKK